MNHDDRRIQQLLEADADERYRIAALPTAHSILWKARMRTTRRRRQRVAMLITLTEILGPGAPALVIIGLMWMTLFDTPVRAHAVTVVVAGILTAVAIGIVVSAPLIAVRLKPDATY